MGTYYRGTGSQRVQHEVKENVMKGTTCQREVSHLKIITVKVSKVLKCITARIIRTVSVAYVVKF